jgi:hypothetical protein
MTNYTEATTKLGNRTRRKLENNTYLEQIDQETIGVKLHNTFVVKYHKNGNCTLDSGGWKTVTTKDRINKYSPVRIYQKKGLWFVDETTLYQDKMILLPTGETQGTEPYQKKAQNKLTRQIGQYAKDYVAALYKGEIPAPSGGDCWLCSLVDTEGRSWGESMHDPSHIISHMEEKYYVPTLIHRAVKRFGGSMAMQHDLSVAFHDPEQKEHKFWPGDFIQEQVKKCLRRYLNEQLGKTA